MLTRNIMQSIKGLNKDLVPRNTLLSVRLINVDVTRISTSVDYSLRRGRQRTHGG